MSRGSTLTPRYASMVARSCSKRWQETLFYARDVVPIAKMTAIMSIKRLRYLIPALKIASRIAEPLAKIPKIHKTKRFYAPYDAENRRLTDTVALDIGCGSVPRNPYKADQIHGIDIRENLGQNIKYADLTVGPIPFEDRTFDFITAPRL